MLIETYHDLHNYTNIKTEYILVYTQYRKNAKETLAIQPL